MDERKESGAQEDETNDASLRLPCCHGAFTDVARDEEPIEGASQRSEGLRMRCLPVAEATPKFLEGPGTSSRWNQLWGNR